MFVSLLFFRCFTYFIFFMLVTFNTIVCAAEKISLQRAKVADVGQSMEIVLTDKIQSMPLLSVNILQFISRHTDKNAITHTRLQQKYFGIPVFGGHAILHAKNHSKAFISGTIYKGLLKDLGKNPPYSLKQENYIYDKFAASFLSENIIEKTIEPVIYIDKQQHAFWAYKIAIYIAPTDAMPQKPTAIVDAKTGDKFQEWDDIKTSHVLVKGIGFGGNQKIGLRKYGNKLPLLEISRDDFSGICYLENQQVKVVDMSFRYKGSNDSMSFTCPYFSEKDAYWTGYNENGYDFVNGAYSPSNDALYIGGIIKKMYKEKYGVEALDPRYGPKKLIMRVHYGKSYSNAFWDGQQMTFGDGNTIIHPLVSLGIGAHEVSHGFTEFNSNLVYFGQSGGMNEAFSDMAAQAAEYYVNKKNSWLIGNDILKSSSTMQAVRFMRTPSLDGRSIDTAARFREGMDVHYSSGVYNRLFYVLANTKGWNTYKAFKLMLKANMDYWTPTSTFDEGACGLIYAAEDFNFSVNDVESALDEVMLNYDLC